MVTPACMGRSYARGDAPDPWPHLRWRGAASVLDGFGGVVHAFKALSLEEMTPPEDVNHGYPEAFAWADEQRRLAKHTQNRPSSGE